MIYLNSSGYGAHGIKCGFPVVSVSVYTNLTRAIESMEMGYGRHRKYLIVVTSPTSIKSGVYRTSTRNHWGLGCSRWLWPLKMSTRAMKFSRSFLCLSMFIQDSSSINAPADFIDCHRRRSLTTDSIHQVETFPKNHMTIGCQRFCADTTNQKSEVSYMNSVVRYLNLSSWQVITTNETRTFETQALAEFRYLLRREADFSMTPSPITYSKAFISGPSFPFN